MKFKDKNNVVLAISAALIVLAVIIAIVATTVEKNKIKNNTTTNEVVSTSADSKTQQGNSTTVAPATTTQPVTNDGNVPGTYTVATQNDPLGVRLNPSADAERIYELPKGSDVKVLCTYDQWAYVAIDGVNGWVNLTYLQLKEKSEAPKHTSGKYTIGTQNDPLGIRVKPQADAQRNGEVPKGEQIEVLTVCGEWGYVNYGEYSGWLSFEYLK